MDNQSEQLDLDSSDQPEKNSGWLRYLSVGILAVLAIGFITTLFLPASENDDISKSAAESIFITQDGSQSSLNEKLDKPVVLNFYASNCAPCRAELPEFDEVYLQVKEEVTFIGINQDVSEQTWRAFDNEVAVSYETVYQPGEEIFRDLGGIGLPMTVLIDTDGKVLRKFSGVLNKEALIVLINSNFEKEF